ncbi:hypothetical protein CAC42_3394 [Sphaceloma murrayae]|uniref:Carbonyl reductase family member 4 n=1 Tax=Sphaceloma murrayae TaxID=2082308 RepID=A0A2K1R194_9PEZI|nr:hypothetical protein CAC42_3394 [Sphaceloma murrayae]
MASYLITGSSRGIGLSVVNNLASKPASEVSTIFAGARSETEALKKVIDGSSGRVVFLPLEITSPESVKEAVENVEQSLGGKGLDVLVNMAGIAHTTPNGIETMTDLNEHFNTNVVGTHNVTTAFLPLLRKGAQKKVINISTTMASKQLSHVFKPQPTPAYKISKAALNMLTVQYAESFTDEGFTFVAVCPGWVKTDMGTQNANIEVHESAAGIVEIVQRITTADSGKFVTVRVPGWEESAAGYNGGERPW